MIFKIKNLFKNKFKINKFYYEDIILAGNGFKFERILINFFFIIKFIINSVLKLTYKNFYKVNKRKLNESFLNLSDKKNSKCLIVGLGPSINNIDFKNLKGLDTFVTSTFYRHKNFLEFEPTFYCFLDTKILVPTNDGQPETKKNKLDSKRLSSIKNFLEPLKKNIRSTKIIVPYQSTHESINKNKLFNDTKSIKFVYLSSGYINQILPTKLNLQSGIPNDYNVLPWMVAIALSMNYKEIYLAGAEQDMWLNGSHANKTIEESLDIKDSNKEDYIANYYKHKKFFRN